MEPQPVVVAPGTSLAVLQAYPLGTLQIETLAACVYSGVGERFSVYGFNTLLKNAVGVTDGKHPFWLPPSKVLPCLRPFSALCQPLPDGTVPAAIDFVRSFLADQYNMDWSGAHIERVYENGDIMVSIPDRHPQRYDHSYILHPDWGGLPLEAHSWLVKNHFAVGLTPDQFLPLS